MGYLKTLLSWGRANQKYWLIPVLVLLALLAALQVIDMYSAH
jgi:uncharacterized protein DUF5989